MVRDAARSLGREVAIIDYAPSGTGFLAKNVQKKVAGGDNAFIIANHGIVAVGTASASEVEACDVVIDAGRTTLVEAADRLPAFLKRHRAGARAARVLAGAAVALGLAVGIAAVAERHPGLLPADADARGAVRLPQAAVVAGGASKLPPVFW